MKETTKIRRTFCCFREYYKKTKNRWLMQTQLIIKSLKSVVQKFFSSIKFHFGDEQIGQSEYGQIQQSMFQ